MIKKQLNRDGLKEILPYGAIKEIAGRSNVSIFTVSKVIKGRSNNPFVLKTIKEYIQEIQKTKEDLNCLIAESQMTA